MDNDKISVSRAIPIAIASKNVKDIDGQRPSDEKDFISKNAVGTIKNDLKDSRSDEG